MSSRPARLLRVFISSPSDLKEERIRAASAIDGLAKDFAQEFVLEPYLWEYEPMLAEAPFQDIIHPPSETQIFVLILWSRLGSPLPLKTAKREYKALDGRTPVTGTEWEFDDARDSFEKKGYPRLLAYRKMVDPRTSVGNDAERDLAVSAFKAVKAFWSRHFDRDGSVIRAYTAFETLNDFQDKFQADLVKIIKDICRAERPGRANAALPHGNPYRGLHAYEYRDGPLFYGRAAAIQGAVERVITGIASGRPFLLITGGSGTGKSSLAQAGVLPRLAVPAVSGVALWRRAVVRPGQSPFQNLANALIATDALGELALGKSQDAANLAHHLEIACNAPLFGLLPAFDQIDLSALAKGELSPGESSKLALVIDQLEELFTSETISPERRSAFIECIDNLARSGRVVVIATMRSDYWHRVADVARLMEMQAPPFGRFDLAPMTASEISEVVRRPADAAGLRFDTDPITQEGLDYKLITEAAAEPGALPLLSYLLEELYNKDIAGRNSNVLSFPSAQALGGLKGAISTRAEQVLLSLRGRPEVQEALPTLLRRLVQQRFGEEAVARTASLDDVPDGSPMRSLVSAFLDARLLTTFVVGSKTHVRLAHEALLSGWPRVAEWLKQNRRDLETLNRLEQDKRLWEAASNSKEKRARLLTGFALAEGRDLARRWPSDVGAAQLGDFIQMSFNAARKSARRGYLVAAAVGVILSTFAAVSGIGYWTYKSNAEAMNKTGDEMVTNVVHDSRASRDITVTAKLKILEHAEAAMKDLDSVSDNAGNPAHMLMKIKTYNELASANWIFGRVKKGLDESLESLELNRSLLSPEVSVDKQWDLLKLRYDALNVEGNFLNVQGAFNSATNAFADAEATAISMQKSGNEKRRGEALLDFTQALGRVGDVQRTHRDFDGAIKSYDRSLAIQNAYLKGHPDDRQWISARTQTYNRIGDDLLRITNHEALMTVGPDGTTLLKQESEYLPARIEYRHALADRDRLAELEDKNTDYGRDLVWSLTLYGMSLIPSDLPKAHETLSRAEKRAEEMLNDDKNNTEWIRYRALIHSFLGDTLFLTNRRVEAFEEYEAASQDRETLTGIDSQNLRWQRDKFYTLDRLYRMQTIAQLSEASVTLKVALQLGETIRHLLPGDAALAAEVNDLKYPRNGTIRQ